MTCLFAPALSGCRVAQPPQQETAGLRIDVSRVKQRRGTVDVRLRIWNDHDVKLSFPCGNVRLMVDADREASPRPPRRNAPYEVVARNNQDFRWTFEVGEDLAAGSYEIEVRDFQLDGLPSGQTALFTINL